MSFDKILIIVQIFIVIVSVYMAFTENKKRIYLLTFLINLGTFLLYVINRDTATMISCAVLTVRALAYIYKDRFKTPAIPIAFIAIHLVMGAFTIEDPWQLLPILAPCFTAAYMWWGKTTQELRFGAMITCAMWSVYEGLSGLYIVMICDGVTALANLISLIWHLVRKKKPDSEEAAVFLQDQA